MRKPPRLIPMAAVVVLAVTTAGAVATGASGAATHLAAASTASSASRRLACAGGPATVRPVLACGQLATDGGDFSNVPDAPTYILSATQTGRGRAAVCRVTGYIAPQEQFQLALPVRSYTGRYMQAGCGGLCGWSLSQPSSTAANCPTVMDLAAASGDQFAGGTDNGGHIGGENDALWAREDPALRVTFGYTSEHALAQAAKAIITAYYGKPPVLLLRRLLRRRPGGAGRSAALPPGLHRHPRWCAQQYRDRGLAVVPAWVIAVNTGAHGREILTSQELPALHAAVVKACGNAQGLIEDPRSCGFNPATIECPAGVNNSSCLTPAQVHVVREIYLGPSDGHGHYLYPGGEPYGSELEWAGLAIDPPGDRQWPQDTKAYQAGQSSLKYAAYWHNPPASFQLKDFRFTVAAYRKLYPWPVSTTRPTPACPPFAKPAGNSFSGKGGRMRTFPRSAPSPITGPWCAPPGVSGPARTSPGCI